MRQDIIYADRMQCLGPDGSWPQLEDIPERLPVVHCSSPESLNATGQTCTQPLLDNRLLKEDHSDKDHSAPRGSANAIGTRTITLGGVTRSRTKDHVTVPLVSTATVVCCHPCSDSICRRHPEGPEYTRSFDVVTGAVIDRGKMRIRATRIICFAERA